MSYSIHPLGSEHYDALWQLFLVVFPIKYKNEFLDAWLARTPELSHGAFSTDGSLVGFIVTGPKADGQQIEFLGVSPSAQQGGIGSLLLKKVLNQCREMRTRVMLIPVNEPRVICWYKKHGFEPFGAPHVSPYTGELEQRMALGPAAQQPPPPAIT